MSPVRLAKHEEKTVWDKVDDFALSHANILLPAAMITLIVLIVGLCYSICGLCAVESGMLRNFLARGV